MPRPLELRLPASPTEAATCHHIVFGDRIVEYAVRRSARRRSIAFSIDARGLRVGAPLAASRHHIEYLLQQNAHWITRKLAEWDARQPAVPRWETGGTLFVEGAPVTLAFDPACDGTALADARLVLALPEQTAPPTVQTHALRWLHAHALARFRERAAALAPLVAAPLPEVKLSRAHSRWGSCTAAGRILINWRLIQVPPAWTDYVIVHELAHLLEMNHSARFWRVVERAIPDYALRRRALRRDAWRYLVA